MPYKVNKSGEKWCVHKENSDGSIGGKVACHDSEKEAREQIKALYASEESKSLGVELDEYIFSEILEEEKSIKAANQNKVDDVYKKFSSLVNMSASELERWADSPCSREASLTRAPIKRVLGLLRKNKDDWDANDVKQANRVISFISRMRGVEDSDNVSEDCPYSKKQISLRNWGRKSMQIEIEAKIEEEDDEMEAEAETEMDDERSFEEIQSSIRKKWYEDGFGYINAIYPDYIIVSANQSHWKVPYKETSNGCEFASNQEWKKVKLKTEWVEKHFDDLFAIKSVGEGRIGAYGIIWGDETRKDVHDEFFTQKTQDIKSAFDAIGALPWLFHHGADSKLKSTVVGIIDKMEVDDVGLWYEAKIKEHDIYKRYVKPLISEKKLFSSSGCYPGSKERNRKTGEITRWTVAEISGTHIPAEYRMLEMPVGEVKSLYLRAGIDEKNIKSFITSESEEALLVEVVEESEEDNTAKSIRAQVEARNRVMKLKLRLNKTGENNHGS